MIVKSSSDLIKLIDKALESGKPLTIETEKGKAIVISEENYNSMVETIYLVSQPGLIKNIK